jgi:hypothetical protein
MDASIDHACAVKIIEYVVGALQQARETQEEKESMDHLLSLSLSLSVCVVRILMNTL